MDKKTITALWKDDSAVSPVIGVILMVAITVILAAVIGTFVLGLGENVSKNAQAGVSFSSDDTAGNNVEVQLTSKGNVKNANDITASGCGDGDQTFSSVGGILDFSCNSGDKITVTASIDGSENVIATYEYTG